MLGLRCCAGLSLVSAGGARCLPAVRGLPVERVGSRAHTLSTRRIQALEHRLRSCDTQAWLLRGLWGFPRSRIKPVSPALAGRFSTTEPPWRPPVLSYTVASCGCQGLEM